MPMPAACIEQAFAQESGELFVEESALLRVIVGARRPGDAAATAEGPIEPADRQRLEPRPLPAVFPTGQAA